MQISLLLEMAADAAPQRPLFGPVDDGLTAAALKRLAAGGGAALGAMGDGALCFLGLNGPTLPLALFAASFSGRPFTPLNYRLPDPDLHRLLSRAAPCVLIVDDDMQDRVQAPPPGVTVTTATAFRLLCRDSSPSAAGDEADVAVSLFTSGTTGEPKAALLHHANLVSYVTSAVDFLGAADGETALVSVPPYHVAGISAVLSGVYAGRRTVYLPAFNAEDWVDCAARERVTHAMLVPTMLARVLDVLETRVETLPDLRALAYGGGRMPLSVIERALDLLPHVGFTNAYGLTETSSTIALLGPEDHRAAQSGQDPRALRRLGSVGRPLPGIDIEVRDTSGQALPAGQSGEIFVRGAQVSGRYAGTLSASGSGWFATRDGGWVDEDGYLFVEGRLDDVIVRGGENMSPGEIEEVLRGHPGVADVAVFGVPDPEWGEAIAAVVVPGDVKPATAELAAFARARLRSSKTPQIWMFRDALPYNDMGKLLRRQLRDDMASAGRSSTEDVD